MKLPKVEEIVKEVLKEDEDSRADNFILVYKVYAKVNREAVTLPFSNVMLLHKAYGLPSFESIVRSARKLRADYEELRPSKKVEKARSEKEAEYIDYAINGYNPSFMKFIENQED